MYLLFKMFCFWFLFFGGRLPLRFPLAYSTCVLEDFHPPKCNITENFLADIVCYQPQHTHLNDSSSTCITNTKTRSAFWGFLYLEESKGMTLPPTGQGHTTDLLSAKRTYQAVNAKLLYQLNSTITGRRQEQLEVGRGTMRICHHQNPVPF